MRIERKEKWDTGKLGLTIYLSIRNCEPIPVAGIQFDEWDKDTIDVFCNILKDEAMDEKNNNWRHTWRIYIPGESSPSRTNGDKNERF